MNYQTRNRPPNQVNFSRGPYQRSMADSTNSYLTMPTNTQHNDSDMNNDNQMNRQGEHYYTSHSADAKNDNDNKDHLPEGNLTVRFLNETPVSLFGLALFDSGSTSTLINERAVPPNIEPRLGEDQVVTTTQGTYSSTKYFDAAEIMFPDFCKTRVIPKVHLRTFSSSTSRYDFIVGRDILRLGFILDHAKSRIVWDGLSVPMSVQASLTVSSPTVTHFSCPLMLNENYATGANKIKKAKYESISPAEVVHQCTHLSKSQQIQLRNILQKFSKLFSGQLG